MQIVREIQQHVEQLPENLQAEVLQYILNLKQKQHAVNITDEEALAIHAKLMEQYADTFTKLAQ